MKYYLAYGSNLNKEQMAHRCLGAKAIGTAMIHNCRLEFRRGVLTIEPDENSNVPVGVWEISEQNEKSLDRYEGFPVFYKKETIRVMTDQGMVVNGMAYVMTDGHPIRRPSDSYLLIVAVGYRDFGFDRTPLVEAYDRSKFPELYTTDSTTKCGR